MPRIIIRRNRKKRAQAVIEEIANDKRMSDQITQTVNQSTPRLKRQRRLVR